MRNALDNHDKCDICGDRVNLRALMFTRARDDRRFFMLLCRNHRRELAEQLELEV